MARRKLEYLGEPTLAQVMRRPQWILALLLAIAVAGVFAWLGRWQMDNAIRHNVDELTNTETVRALDDLTEPVPGIPEISAGALASADGHFISGDYVVVSDRMNSGTDDPSSDSERSEGAWVVGHFVRDSGAHDGKPASLAVAIGWAESEDEARAAITQLEDLAVNDMQIVGRYLPAEAPAAPRPDDDPHVMRTMVPAYLANVWNTVPGGPIYGGYLVMHESDEQSAEYISGAGLATIDSVAPGAPEKVSWLNVFYAIEWVVFGAVALFLWYRLARDAWEKEHEIMLLEAEAASGVSAVGIDVNLPTKNPS